MTKKEKSKVESYQREAEQYEKWWREAQIKADKFQEVNSDLIADNRDLSRTASYQRDILSKFIKDERDWLRSIIEAAFGKIEPKKPTDLIKDNFRSVVEEELR